MSQIFEISQSLAGPKMNVCIHMGPSLAPHEDPPPSWHLHAAPTGLMSKGKREPVLPGTMWLLHFPCGFSAVFDWVLPPGPHFSLSRFLTLLSQSLYLAWARQEGFPVGCTDDPHISKDSLHLLSTCSVCPRHVTC